MNTSPGSRPVVARRRLEVLRHSQEANFILKVAQNSRSSSGTGCAARSVFAGSNGSRAEDRVRPSTTLTAFATLGMTEWVRPSTTLTTFATLGMTGGSVRYARDDRGGASLDYAHCVRYARDDKRPSTTLTAFATLGMTEGVRPSTTLTAFATLGMTGGSVRYARDDRWKRSLARDDKGAATLVQELAPLDDGADAHVAIRGLARCGIHGREVQRTHTDQPL